MEYLVAQLPLVTAVLLMSWMQTKFVGPRLEHLTSRIKFKRQYKALMYYSMPNSILFAAKKRLNLVFLLVIALVAMLLL